MGCFGSPIPSPPPWTRSTHPEVEDQPLPNELSKKNAADLEGITSWPFSVLAVSSVPSVGHYVKMWPRME